MTSVVISARTDNPTLPKWGKINDIIFPIIRKRIEWGKYGYDGISLITRELFNFDTRRGASTYVEFIFDTEQDYVLFLLKWS